MSLLLPFIHVISNWFGRAGGLLARLLELVQEPVQHREKVLLRDETRATAGVQMLDAAGKDSRAGAGLEAELDGERFPGRQSR
jgi:hypothetical protein